MVSGARGASPEAVGHHWGRQSLQLSAPGAAHSAAMGQVLRTCRLGRVVHFACRLIRVAAIMR